MTANLLQCAVFGVLSLETAEQALATEHGWVSRRKNNCELWWHRRNHADQLRQRANGVCRDSLGEPRHMLNESEPGVLSNVKRLTINGGWYQTLQHKRSTYMSGIGKCIVFASSFVLISCAGVSTDSSVNVPPDNTSSIINESTHVETSNPPIPEVDVALNCDIEPAFEWMKKQTILYTQSPADEWRDCSGNFLRLSSRIASICPTVQMAAPAGIKVFAPDGDNKRPGKAEARSTRGLAKWYDQKGLFVPIYYDGNDASLAPQSLVAFRNSIKPGTVFWLSFDVPKSSQGKQHLYSETASKKGIIDHMGTVVSIDKDDNDNVISWTMYHGQNSRKHNGITTHRWNKSRPSSVNPQGGWGKQRIVGYAPHLVPELAALN